MRNTFWIKMNHIFLFLSCILNFSQIFFWCCFQRRSENLGNQPSFSQVIPSFGKNWGGEDPQLSRLKNLLARWTLAKFLKHGWVKTWVGILYGGKPQDSSLANKSWFLVSCKGANRERTGKTRSLKNLPRDWIEHVPPPQSLGKYVRVARFFQDC